MKIFKYLFENTWSSFDVFVLLLAYQTLGNDWQVVGVMLVYWVLQSIVRTSIRVYKQK